MARLKIDELNIIDFFSEMNLSQDEIDRRISYAQQVKEMYHRVFTIVKAAKKVDDDLDAEFIEDMLTNGYADIFNADNHYTQKHLSLIVPEVVSTTLKNINDAYYLSDERAKIIAVNDVNSICNNELEEKAIKSGFKYKIWETMKDDKVRHTHIMADGQRVPIDGMFTVGMSEMRFPMDTENGNPEEIINCRCVCIYTR